MMQEKKTRNLNLDLIKFFCAFGVICIHTQNSTFEADLIGDFFSPLCVPFFYLSALVFFISGLKTISLPEIANKIWLRIVIPYFFWTLIYFSLALVKHNLMNQNTTNQWWKILFFGSSAVHLYYIPKMLIMQGFSLSMVLILSQNYKRKFIGFLVFVVSLGWLFYGIENDCFGFNISDFEIIIMYIILAFTIVKLRETKNLTYHFLILGFALFALLILLKYFILSYLSISFSANYLSLIGGLSLTLIAFTLPSISLSKKAAVIFGLSYGVYLSHIIFLEAFEFILKYARVNLFYNFNVKLIFAFVVLCSSILFILLVKKIPLLRKILLGE